MVSTLEPVPKSTVLPQKINAWERNKKKLSNRFSLNSGNPHDLPVPGFVPILSENVSKGTSGGPKLHGVDVRTSTKKYRSTPKNKCLGTELKKTAPSIFFKFGESS